MFYLLLSLLGLVAVTSMSYDSHDKKDALCLVDQCDLTIPADHSIVLEFNAVMPYLVTLPDRSYTYVRHEAVTLVQSYVDANVSKARAPPKVI